LRREKYGTFHANAIFDFHAISTRNARRSNREEREEGENSREGKGRVRRGEGHISASSG